MENHMNNAVEAYPGELKKLREDNEKLHSIFKHALAERTGAFFICGHGEEKDEYGLPTKVLICPAMGSDGFAIYTKTTEYSSPGY